MWDGGEEFAPLAATGYNPGLPLNAASRLIPWLAGRDPLLFPAFRRRACQAARSYARLVKKAPKHRDRSLGPPIVSAGGYRGG